MFSKQRDSPVFFYNLLYLGKYDLLGIQIFLKGWQKHLLQIYVNGGLMGILILNLLFTMVFFMLLQVRRQLLVVMMLHFVRDQLGMPCSMIDQLASMHHPNEGN